MIKYRGFCEDCCCCCSKKEKGEEKVSCCDCKDCCHNVYHYGDIIDGNKQFKYALFIEIGVVLFYQIVVFIYIS